MANKTIIRLSENPPGFGVDPKRLEQKMFASALPIQHSHLYYSDDREGIYVGVWDTTDMVEVAAPYPCDEFMWLIEGEAKIKNCSTGDVESIQAGESFVIPRGYNCQWHQEGYLRKFFFIYENPDESVPQDYSHEGIVLPDALDTNSSSDEASFFAMAGNKSASHIKVDYKNAARNFLAGTWDIQPFTSEFSAFPCHQLAYVESGTMMLVDENCDEHVFEKGGVFFIPKGALCFGKSADHVRLIFAAVTGI